MRIHFVVNGEERDLEIAPELRLIDILREQLHLTGTKEGCGIGECGACTVLMNGKAVHACLVLGCQLQDKEIITIEGLAKNGEYDMLQKKFVEHGAVQCGFCTAGMIMSAKALLLETPNPTEAQIRRAIEGNLCRCTGYSKIVEAIQDTSGSQHGEEHA
ncbi:MAG: (2Fe-2S)-binding protein [Clostridia bacterium]